MRWWSSKVQSMSPMSVGSALLLIFSLFSYALAYLEKCPLICKCTPSTLSCVGASATNWPDILRYLAAPDAVNILNITIRHGFIPSLHYLPYIDHLEYLDLTNNQIDLVDFSDSFRYDDMRTLILADNNITELSERSFAPFLKLEELDLRNNSIKSLKVDHLRLVKLRRFDLSHNKLKQVWMVFRQLSFLESLDLSHNHLLVAKSSDFAYQQRLRFLNLSHNSLSNFDFDNTYMIVRLEEIDLSYNTLKSCPGANLKNFVNLVFLNISGNPFIKIPAWNFEFERLQVVVASHMPNLRVVEGGAFSKARDLHTVDLSNNPVLTFISPSAFENCSALHSLDVRNTSLSLLYTGNIVASQVYMEGGAYNCECMAREADEIPATTIVDWERVRCTMNDNSSHSLSSARPGECPPFPILGGGAHITSTVGQTDYIYCASRLEGDEIVWTLPNGTVLPGTDSLKPLLPATGDYMSNSLYGHFVPDRQRISASREWLKLDVVTPWDEGEYLCTVRRGRSQKTAKITLSVQSVNIKLIATGMGAHFISLLWNDTMSVQAFDRVVLRLRVIDDQGRELPILHSLLNPWTTYNVMRLRPETNYTICLEYALAEELNRNLFSSCTEASTLTVPTFFQNVPSSVFVSIFVILSLVGGAVMTRYLWNRLHVWQQTKYRSRLNQSVSGQSIISHSSTANSVTYENQQIALCRVPSGAESRGYDITTTRLLNPDIDV